MGFDLIFEPAALSPAQLESQLAHCNQRTARWGLALTLPQLQELTARRFTALKRVGRVEFGAGVLEELALAFAGSPHIDPAGYHSSLLELQDVFYYFRNEAPDDMTDTELIEAMRRVFNSGAGGSVEYLAGTALEELCRALRRGENIDDPQQQFKEEYDAYCSEAEF